MNKPRRTKRQNSRSTIGFLTVPLTKQYRTLMWSGVADVSRERGTNAICFPSGKLRSPNSPQDWHEPYDHPQRNVLYDLVSAETLDGLAIWGWVGSDVGPEEFRDLIERFQPLPVVSIALALEGIPAVLADNYGGMRDEIVHLIEVHGYRRIAFIRSEQKDYEEHEDRYRAYTDTLAEYGLPFDPDLVVSRDDIAESGQPHGGEAAVHILLDQRKAEFEAVVANNDRYALQAMSELRVRGIRVPGGVAFAGFDNDESGKCSMPPLTTVPFPAYELGRRAAEILLAQIEEEQVPERAIIPTKLIVRQSCGCLDPAVVQAAVGVVKTRRKKLQTALTTQREEILAEMVQAVGVPVEGLGSKWAGQLLDGFAAELEGEAPGVFLSALDEVLRQVAVADGDVAAWQGAVSVLRRYVLPYLGDEEASSRVEDLLNQARVAIGATTQRAQAYQRLQEAKQAQTLHEIGQALITTFDVGELVNVVAEGLPRLGIPSCYLSLYEAGQSPAQESRLILAYNENGRVELEAEGRRFPSPHLVPDGVLPQGKQVIFVVEPLYFQQNQLGVALFEEGPREGMVYETLRGEISSALQGALLLQERERAQTALEDAYAEVEKQIEERTAELKQEVAERERLQQEVIEAQKQALQDLSTPIIPVMDRIMVMPLVGSIDTMRAREITRALLAGIREHQAKVVILDITGVPIVDSGVASHLNKTIQAARLKGAQTIVTGISDAVAETIVDLGIDWSGIETLRDLQTGLRAALAKMGQRIERMGKAT